MGLLTPRKLQMPQQSTWQLSKLLLLNSPVFRSLQLILPTPWMLQMPRPLSRLLLMRLLLEDLLPNKSLLLRFPQALLSSLLLLLQLQPLLFMPLLIPTLTTLDLPTLTLWSPTPPSPIMFSHTLPSHIPMDSPMLDMFLSQWLQLQSLLKLQLLRLNRERKCPDPLP